MAKKEIRDGKVEKNAKKSSALGGFFRDERTRFALGVVVLIGVIYLFLAMLSFLFSASIDQSVMHVSGAPSVENWTGARGARLAEMLINSGFGVSTFFLLIFPTVFGLYLLKIRLMMLWKAFIYSAFWTVWGSLFFSCCFFKMYASWAVSLGGGHGDALRRWLFANIGWGVALLLAGALVVYLLFTSEKFLKILKKLFNKKREEKLPEPLPTPTETEELEPEPAPQAEASVAVGTEILPEDWVEIPQKKEDEKEAENGEIKITTTAPTDEISEFSAPDDEEVAVVTDLPDDGEVVENQGENFEPYDPKADLSHYKYPTLDLLKEYPNLEVKLSDEESKADDDRIIKTLRDFGIEIKSINKTIGPTITLYEIVPADGVRISKVRNLEADIMLSLAAIGIRIIAPIPGKGTIGIEVPNRNSKIVSMHATIGSKKFQESAFELPVALGRTITNEVFMFDLAKMPHLLVAGATGQGKSVGLNAIITSLLYKKHPAQLKFVLIDPKKVEFNIYADIENHFLAKLPDADEPVITDVEKVKQTLNSICQEMDARYDLLKMAHTRNIKEYNEKFTLRRLNPEKGHRYLPYIVVIVDEFGDLIMTAGKEVEMPIARIAQLARAVGIHMVIATQRPSVNIITGIIKANFPARIAFKVSAMVDSKTILDTSGAQQLIGKGDLLFSQGGEPVRVQCAFVDTPEVENVVHFISEQQRYPSAFLLPEPQTSGGDGGLDISGVDLNKRDAMFEEVARFIVASAQGSTSSIQRKFSLGYNRAGKIMDQLEAASIVGPQEGSKPRQVLIQTEYELEKILSELR